MQAVPWPSTRLRLNMAMLPAWYICIRIMQDFENYVVYARQNVLLGTSHTSQHSNFSRFMNVKTIRCVLQSVDLQTNWGGGGKPQR